MFEELGKPPPQCLTNMAAGMARLKRKKKKKKKKKKQSHQGISAGYL
jgi:hypothetical protein